jgi:hypothetical protein
MEETTIKVGLLKKILKEAIANGRHSDFVLEVLLRNNSTYPLKYITDVLTDDPEKVELLNLHDLVMVEAPRNHIETKFNIDILSEMGLLVMINNEPHVFGFVMGDDSWSSGYNPYYGRVKVCLFYHDSERNLSHHNEAYASNDVKKVKPSDIPRLAKLRLSDIDDELKVLYTV